MTHPIRGLALSRRSFLSYCAATAAVLGLGPVDLFKLKTALARAGAPKVLWLQGSGCSGCSISFLNHVSETAPMDAGAVLTDSVDLLFHPTLMWASGQQAVSVATSMLGEGGYILVVEGGVPAAFGGGACLPWSESGTERTFAEVVKKAATKADRIICVGTCAAYGGVSAAGENPTEVQSVQTATGQNTINIPGCPPHPSAIVWVMAQLLAGSSVQLDGNGRPTEIFGRTVHSACPRRRELPGNNWSGANGTDNLCLELLGCRGPDTHAPCPTWLWNDKVNWCVDANGNCIGCTEPDFPGTHKFHRTPF